MSLYAKLDIPKNGDLEDMPIMDADPEHYEQAKTLSVFGNERDARAFINNNRQMLNEKAGWDDDAEIQTLANRKTGEILGAYLRRTSQANAEDQANAMRSALN